MSLIPNPAPDKYGGVTVSPDGFVTGFTRAGAAVESSTSSACKLAEAFVFSRLEDNVKSESVTSLPCDCASPLEASRVSSATRRSRYRYTARLPRNFAGARRRRRDRLISASARIDESAVVERTAVGMMW